MSQFSGASGSQLRGPSRRRGNKGGFCTMAPHGMQYRERVFHRGIMQQREKDERAAVCASKQESRAVSRGYTQFNSLLFLAPPLAILPFTLFWWLNSITPKGYGLAAISHIHHARTNTHGRQLADTILCMIDFDVERPGKKACVFCQGNNFLSLSIIFLEMLETLSMRINRKGSWTQFHTIKTFTLEDFLCRTMQLDYLIVKGPRN